MIKLIVYDLDGTLVDSLKDISNAVNWTLCELKLKRLSEKAIASHVGYGVVQLIRGVLLQSADWTEQLLQEATQKAVRLYQSHYADHLLDETKLYPDVRRVLDQLQHLKQAVLTNKPEHFSKQILSGLGVEPYFFKVIGGDQKFQKKPAPDAVFALIEAAGVSADETVLVGDSKIDVLTGKNAGVKTVAVTYGFNPMDQIISAGPDFVIPSLTVLPSLPLFV